MFTSTSVLVALVGSVSAGNVLWDGRLNEYSSSAFLDDWSWSNAVGPYQYYIHGDGPTSDYVNVGPDFKNPADSNSNGIQVTIDETSTWNGDSMLRTELIPQTDAAINKGKVFYHFSMQHTGTNAPSASQEHQVCFFESHFTEMKYGLTSGAQGTADKQLRWYANGESQWDVTFEAGVWHNIAYGINFDAGTVAFYHSTGADDLELTVEDVSVDASSNGADWHLGVLRLQSGSGSSDGAEDWNFSGVYIESGDLTKSVSGSSGSSGSKAASAQSGISSATQRKTSSTTAAQTTFQTKVKPSSSSMPAEPVSSSSNAVQPAASSSTAATSISISSVSPVSQTSTKAVSAPATSSAAATTVASSSSRSESSSHRSSGMPTQTTSTPTLSTPTPAGEQQCELKYVYVDA
ncbi:glycoside hydrolase family 131 protein [Hortaea werneckii]|nr:glycoside hydrolase family 131 protein [Hortaea werneckii]KAI6990624.1 glycoside hydrolase family 131 protein [Hortaea werneckii]KAI7140793.1 glycoside hydrolase family 131 protein [Hortaea werneckii]KAI7171507.1 glycoside hydrolase family 131 protein [Hortaea werneckii]